MILVGGFAGADAGPCNERLRCGMGDHTNLTERAADPLLWSRKLPATIAH